MRRSFGLLCSVVLLAGCGTPDAGPTAASPQGQACRAAISAYLDTVLAGIDPAQGWAGGMNIIGNSPVESDPAAKKACAPISKDLGYRLASDVRESFQPKVEAKMAGPEPVDPALDPGDGEVDAAATGSSGATMSPRSRGLGTRLPGTASRPSRPRTR